MPGTRRQRQAADTSPSARHRNEHRRQLRIHMEVSGDEVGYASLDDDSKTMILEVEELAEAYTKQRHKVAKAKRAIKKLLTANEELEEYREKQDVVLLKQEEENEELKRTVSKLTLELDLLRMSTDSIQRSAQTDPVIILDGSLTGPLVATDPAQDGLLDKLRTAGQTISQMRSEQHDLEVNCRTLETTTSRLREERDGLQVSVDRYSREAETSEKHYLNLLELANGEIATLRRNIDMVSGSLTSAQETITSQNRDLLDGKAFVHKLSFEKKELRKELRREEKHRYETELTCEKLQKKMVEAQRTAAMAAAQLEDGALAQSHMEELVEELKRQLRRKDAKRKEKEEESFVDFVQFRRTIHLLEHDNEMLKLRLQRIRDKVRQAGLSEIAGVRLDASPIHHISNAAALLPALAPAEKNEGKSMQWELDEIIAAGKIK